MGNFEPAQDTPAGTSSSAWLELPDGTTFWLTEALCTIGRTGAKSILLPHSYVSSSHAVIEADSDGCHTLTDLRSTNGTFIDGRRLSTPTRLHNGSKIKIGPFQIIYRNLEKNAFDPRASDQTGGSTMVQTYDGPCWLLLLDLEGFTARRQSLGQEKAGALIREWICEAKPFIEGLGGVINGQPGDALLAYWRNEDPSITSPSVDTSLRGLLSLRQRTRQQRPFRIILHRGTVQITTNATRAEYLAGPDVDFLFRIEKLAKPLGVSCLLSEPACLGLGLSGEARPLGAQKVPDFDGQHLFYTVDIAESPTTKE